jgi:hypothetical protein
MRQNNPHSFARFVQDGLESESVFHRPTVNDYDLLNLKGMKAHQLGKAGSRRYSFANFEGRAI